MIKHHGQIVEYIIRRNGFSLSHLALELKVNRRSLYNWFQNQYLKKSVIYNIGHAIRHDFSIEFPELFVTEDFDLNAKSKYHHTNYESNSPFKKKYMILLERYNEILLEEKYGL